MAPTRKITNKVRAAAVIVTLGADEAAEIYKYLREE